MFKRTRRTAAALRPERKKELQLFERHAGIRFRELESLNQAFTHRSFAHESEGLLDSARAALAGDRAEDLHRAVHTLRSTSASFGALELSSLCREAEARAKEREAAALAPLLDRIDEELTRVRKALETLPGEGPIEP